METQRICPSCHKPLPTDVPLGLCPECLIKSGFNTGTEPGNPGKESGFVPPPVEELRKLFPQLEILELIGKGGMGAVYKARQLALDRLVALKILPPGAADDAGFAERFNREARALARLNHPHIVAVHDFGQAGGQPYLVMEFVDGPNLRQVEQAGRLTPQQALEIVPQICEALQFAHNEGVVHRDIKPENILLDKKGRVKITDFGIAKIVGVPAGKASLTGAKDVLGTPHYMSPEQVEKPAMVDHRADIYSLGVVFYEMLTGELPLGKFQPPSKKVQVDVRLDEVVLHTLEKEPERRYQQASQVKTDVETIAATPSSGSSGRESAPSEAARPPASGGKNSNAIEATIVFVGTGFFLFLLAVVAETSLKAGPLRGFLVVTCVVGLVICALSLAGIWPFPSPWFPEPNFSSRNLRRRKTAGSSQEGLSAPSASSDASRSQSQLTPAATEESRLSPLAVSGAGWLLICVAAQVWSYTPPGWAFNQALRSVFGNFLAEGLKALFVVVGFAAPVGVTVLGWVAATEIRRSGGRVRGLGLASGEMVLFPLLALDAWLLWLCSQTGLKLVLGAAAVLAADALLIYWVWRWVHRPLAAVESTPVRPDNDLAATVPLASQLWRVARRAALVAALSLLLLETLLQLSVGWRESTDELWTMTLYSACLAAMVWAAWPLRRQPWTVLLRAGAVFALFAAVSVTSGFYRGHLRPNLGLYREPDWVAQHPAFQKQWRQRIEKNLWRKPAVGPTNTTSFGSVTERVLYSVATQRPIKAEDLDAGREIEVPAGTEKAGEDQFFHWLAVQGADLLAIAHKQSWDLWASPKLVGVPQAMWDQASGEELLKALRSGVMGLGRASLDVKEGFASYQVNDTTVFPQTFAFQTQAGALGVLQITSLTESPRGVKIRYKREQTAPANGLAYGLVIERELPDPDNGSGRGNRETLRLRTGDRVSVLDDSPKESGGRLRALVASEGDLFAEYDDFVAGRWALVTAGLKFSDLLPGEWETATPEELNEALRQPSALQRTEHSGAVLYLLPEGLLPLTLALESRSGERGLLQITGFTDNPRGVKLRYKLVNLTNTTATLSPKLAQRGAPAVATIEALPESDRRRALALFNDIEDFGHEFEAAFASTNLAAAQTGVRRLLTLLANFNVVVQGTSCEFPAATSTDITKVGQALAAGDWEQARRLARHNEEYARVFRQIGGRMTELAREMNWKPPPGSPSTSTNRDDRSRRLPP